MVKNANPASTHCEKCGGALTPEQKWSRQRFCSRQCWFSWHTGHNHQQFDRVELTCEWCSKHFSRNKFEVAKVKHHYCSGGCASKAHSLKMRGVLDGEPRKASYYNLGNWRRVRLDAIARDGFQCVKCGMTEAEHRSRYKCGLHVDHIVKRRNGGGDELANLQSLCCVCHNKKTTVGA